MLKNKLSKEDEIKFCDEFRRFFNEERDEDIGIIQTQNFLEFFLESLGPKIFNNGIDISRNAIINKFEEFDFELEELKK